MSKPRGFAAMTPERQREIASKGGKAVPASKRSFHTNRALAATAGRKGGQNVAAENRSFARDPSLAVAAGKKGGVAVAPEKRSFSVDNELAREAGRKGGAATRGAIDATGHLVDNHFLRSKANT